LNPSDEANELLKSIQRVVFDFNEDRYMLLEYLIPILDGCKAALNVNVTQALNLEKFSEEQFETHLESTDSAFKELAICMRVSNSEEEYNLDFNEGIATITEEMEEPNVFIIGSYESLILVLDADPKTSLKNLLGDEIKILSHESQDAIDAIGFLCFSELYRVASSGVDPTNLESEDADSVIAATATELITSTLKRWIEIQVSDQPSP
jgi:hypothetical protein